MEGQHKGGKRKKIRGYRDNLSPLRSARGREDAPHPNPHPHPQQHGYFHFNT